MSEFFTPDVGNITATAILGWYAWHTATRTIPELLTAFREELETAREECREERETLREELNAEREERHANHLAILAALHGLTERFGAVDSRATSPNQDRRPS